MKRRHRLLLAGITAAAAIVVLAGCDTVQAGVITGKEYTAPHDTSSMVCTGYGKYGCIIWAPITNHVAARWTLDLSDGKATGQVDVTEVAYNSVKPGDRWPVGTK